MTLKNLLKLLKSSILLGMVFAHAFVSAEEFIIESNPEGAEVFVKRSPSDEPTRIGVTPLNMPVSQLRSQFGLSAIFDLTITAEGYQPHHIVIAAPGDNKIELAVRLKIDRDVELTKKFDRIAANLFEAQRLTRDGSYDQALQLLEDVDREESFLSITNEMRGGIHYLRQDFQRALAAYRRAFAINSENRDAYSMKLYLERALGVSQ